METVLCPGLTLSPLEFRLTFPSLYADDIPPEIAWNRVPIIVDLIPAAQPQTPRQYRVPLEARMGIQEHLTKLRDRGILSANQFEITHSCQARSQEKDTNQYRI